MINILFHLICFVLFHKIQKGIQFLELRIDLEQEEEKEEEKKKRRRRRGSRTKKNEEEEEEED